MSKNLERGSLRWLHFSDLLFRAEEKWDRRATLAALIQKVRELKEEGRRPDLVFLTGDIAFSGKKAEYDQAFRFLDQLQAATGLDPSKRFFLIPGNHDVDREKVRRTEGRLLLAQNQGEIEELLRDRYVMQLLGRRLDEFYAFTERIQGPARGWTPERPWRVDFPDVETGPGSFAVLQLNSAWASGSNDERHLLVGQLQVREALLEAEGVALKFALMHHPISDMAELDRESLEASLPSSVQVLLLGHHRQPPRLVRYPSGPLAELPTGVNQDEDSYERGFSVGELRGAGRLELQLFAYRKSDGGFWAPDSSSFHEAPNGVWVMDLDLPGDKRRTAPSVERVATVTARYRQAVQQVHGIARFVGFADNRPRPNAQVADLFVPLRLESIRVKEESWTTARLLSWLAKPGIDRPGAVLLGDPGSGKTTFSRFAAVWFAGGVKVEGAASPKKNVLPLFLPFREYAQVCALNDCSLIGFLEDQAANHLQVKLPEGFLESEIEKGGAVLLLDGMDEVGDSGARQAMRERVLAFCAQFPRLPVLITSRVASYDEAPLPTEDRGGFQHFRLAGFNDEDLALFVRNWYSIQEPVDLIARDKGVEELSAAFQADPRVRELATNPLLATLIALVHRFEAHLPGERAKLYELCVKTLLETWPAARKRRFEEIDEGLQRVYLEDLALRMQEERESLSRKVVIGVEPLFSTFIEILLTRNREDREVVRRRIERWIQHLEGNGLLVEQRSGMYSFSQLSFLEYLAACALDRGGQPTFDRVVELSDQMLWREVCLLAVGRKATDKKFLDLLFEQLAGKKAWNFLLDGLREEADFDDSQRAQILRGVGRQLLDMSSYSWHTSQKQLGRLRSFSLRHAEWSRAWIENEVRSARQEDLQGVVALCYDAEGEVIKLLSQRADGGEIAIDLLDFWPSSQVGQWAASHAPFSAAFSWARISPDELVIIRAMGRLSFASPATGLGLAAGLLSARVGRSRMTAATGMRGNYRLSKETRPGGSGLPLQIRSEPGGRRIRCAPRWPTGISFAGIFDSHKLQRFASELAGEFSSKIVLSGTRDFTQTLSPVRVLYSVGEFVGEFVADGVSELSRFFFPDIFWEFSRFFARPFTLHSAGEFALDLAPDFVPKAQPVYSNAISESPLEGDAPKLVGAETREEFRKLVPTWVGRLAGESWVAMVSTLGEADAERIFYLLARIQNAWLLEVWPQLDGSMSQENIVGADLALYLALGWTQATTSYQWPGTDRWKQLLSGPPPAHWLPRTQWHLCWLLHDPENAEHRAAINSAFEEGRHDAELPGVAEALVEDLGWEE